MGSAGHSSLRHLIPYRFGLKTALAYEVRHEVLRSEAEALSVIRWLGSACPQDAAFVLVDLPEIDPSALQQLTECVETHRLQRKLRFVIPASSQSVVTCSLLRACNVQSVLGDVGPGTRFGDMAADVCAIRFDAAWLHQVSGDSVAESLLEGMVHIADNLGLRTIGQLPRTAAGASSLANRLDYVAWLDDTTAEDFP